MPFNRPSQHNTTMSFGPGPPGVNPMTQNQFMQNPNTGSQANHPMYNDSMYNNSMYNNQMSFGKAQTTDRHMPMEPSFSSKPQTPNLGSFQPRYTQLQQTIAQASPAGPGGQFNEFQHFGSSPYQGFVDANQTPILGLRPQFQQSEPQGPPSGAQGVGANGYQMPQYDTGNQYNATGPIEAGDLPPGGGSEPPLRGRRRARAWVDPGS